MIRAGGGDPGDGNRATPQGGVLEGVDPSKYDPKNPIILFIIQASIIIIFCRILHWPLSLIRQPRVIAEVIGGIVLGPSVMFRIPGFQEAIFPAESMPILNLTANLGLILFLFLIALEVDMTLFRANWKVALSVGFAGMLLPFGMGVGIAWGLYHQFRQDDGVVPITFGVYALFIGTALSITAFPVLCRILTELNLLSTPVGVTVLAAGVGNDVTGWVLLALCVALVNNGSGIAALYVVLCTVGWVLFLVFAVKPVLHWILKKNGSIERGPSQGMVTLILLLTLLSSWFTGIIGVHPIFGGFLVGLICPHDRGFTVKLTEKIEDLVTVVFLPLYFTLSGLNTDLGLLKDGMAWAYTIGVIAIAFAGKIIGGTLAARACKLVWRESLTIGVLMSCKGLVELIVLNIGLQAKILSVKTFTIFVIMALVTTFATTPLVQWLYPQWYQKKLDAWKRGEISWDGTPLRRSSDLAHPDSLEKLQSSPVSKLLVYLRLESLPSLFTFISLLSGEKPAATAKIHPSKVDATATAPTDEAKAKAPLEVHGLRLLPLTERTSSVMRVAEASNFSLTDPVVNAFRTFASLNDLAVSGGVTIVPETSFAGELTTKAEDLNTDLVIIPWAETGAAEGESSLGGSLLHSEFNDASQAGFVRQALDDAKCNAVVLVNSGFGGPSAKIQSENKAATTSTLTRATSHISVTSLRHTQTATTRPLAERSHHIFFPFIGGRDDRVALRFVLLLAKNSNVTATILHLRISSPSSSAASAAAAGNITPPAAAFGGGGEDSKAPASTALASNSSQQQSTQDHDTDTAFLHTLRDSLHEDLKERVVFGEIETGGAMASVLGTVLERAKEEVGFHLNPRGAGDLVVLGRNRDGSDVWGGGSEVGRALGGLAEGVLAGVRVSVLVVQAGRSGV